MNENQETNAGEPNTTSTTSSEVTKVTTLAQEDAKTGTKTPLPSPEEMVSRASASLLQKRQMLYNVMSKLSKKATLRVIAAATDLPAEGLPVLLKSEAEKMAYMLLQRIQSDKFIIIQDSISKEIKRIKQEKEATKQQEGESTNG